MDISIAFNYELFVTIIAFWYGLGGIANIISGISGIERESKPKNYGGGDAIKGFVMFGTIAVCLLV